MSLDFKGKNFQMSGVDELLKTLETQFGDRRMASIENTALNEAAENFKDGLAEAISVYEDTGETISETTRSRATKKAHGQRTVRVGWRGPKGRYKLIHLNEFGYVRWGKSYSPRGSGVIRAYVDKAGSIYVNDVRKGLIKIIERTGS